jgi:Transmembrane domain of unknown function (DUF3566)
MSIPESGAEPLDAEHPSTSSSSSTKTRDASVSTGSTRTPPPRTRRGAPTGAGRSRNAEPNGDRESSSAAKSGGPKPTAASTKVFNWDDDGVASASAASATAALTAAAVAPLEEPEDAYEPARQPRATNPAKARKPERRFRQTVQRIDLWSVTKMALCFYISAMAVVVVALIALWAVADSAGIIDNVETFIGDLFSADDFHFLSDQVLRGAVLVAIVVVALMVVFTIIAASFYNIFAELFGGIEITIREEEHPPKR